ncbi:hypothetical protein BD779DRAFT_574961 [Infundibulicybe gibba]|nr:hypothetical protein BD779DRAFT_574961 [Infundibulicybe gibba]
MNALPSPIMSIPTAQTINGIMIGVVLAGIANGVLAVQMCRYFRKPGNDLLFKKLFVLFIWLATAIHLFLAMAAFHTEAITEYEESILVMIYPEAGLAVAGVGGAIQSSVQSIYIYRLYKLTGHRAFPAVCLALSTYIVGTGIAYTSDVKSELLMDAVLRNPTGWSWLICSYLSVVVATDILIAASTCWYLIQRRDSGLKSTRRLVNRIMLRIVQTGVATSVVALCVLILFTTCNTSIWLSLYMLLAPRASHCHPAVPIQG